METMKLCQYWVHYLNISKNCDRDIQKEYSQERKYSAIYPGSENENNKLAKS